MLFDTSSPNRKRAVQITFGLLAVLMGGGLVLFGVGGATSGGGLVDAFGNNNVTDVAKSAEKDAKAAQKVLDENPKDTAAAAKLARARFVIASQGAFDATTGSVTKEGQPLIDQADAAWTAYLALGPARPDPGLGIQFAQFYASNGVAKYDKAARAIEATLVTRKPSSGLYYQLAIYALASGDDAKYSEARTRALDLAPNAERRAEVKKQIDDIKQQIDEARAEQAKQAGTTATGSTPLKSLPSLGG